ncbi:hypothetical protein DQ04_00961090 [Trypanosoma grayi]|uniref:hypothetical protein n=1 Tax=Trypanosoma grayi TaxID=71804 RepID=UPI0004F48B87|nr:hypothetical protein DQ04_00961090 [Trypanosoma grayi]KEG13516.1 hypothetical protein DQ04_00961090 [Trypanosoma grayi]
MDAVEVTEVLVTHRGTVPLWPLEVVCGDCYDACVENMRRLLWFFLLDSPCLMDAALGTTPRTISQFHYSFADAAHMDGKACSDDTRTFCFKVWELKLGFPLLPAVDTVPENCCFPSSVRFAALSDPDLCTTPQGYGLQHVIDVVYNGPRCNPIIVSGFVEGIVVRTMRVASLFFVTGVLQDSEDVLHLRIQPSSVLRIPSSGAVHRFAVVGCHVDAALQNGSRLSPQAWTWHVEREAKTCDFRTVVL